MTRSSQKRSAAGLRPRRSAITEYRSRNWYKHNGPDGGARTGVYRLELGKLGSGSDRTAEGRRDALSAYSWLYSNGADPNA